MNTLKPFYFPASILFILTTLLSPLRAASLENGKEEPIYEEVMPSKVISSSLSEDFEDSAPEAPSLSFFQKYKKWIIGGTFLALGTCVLGGILFFPKKTPQNMPWVIPQDATPDSFPQTKEDVNKIGMWGDISDTTPLLYAIEKQKEEWVKSLLDNGADPDLMDHNKRIPILEAVCGPKSSRLPPHKGIISLLLEKGANPTVCVVEDWLTPLHWAALKGHIEIITLLLDKKADINLKEYNGRTPLHLVLKNSQTLKDVYETVKCLLKETKTKVNTQDLIGNTPLHEVVKRVTEKTKDADCDAALEIIDLLISHPSLDDVASYINSTNKYGNTALDMVKNVKIGFKLGEYIRPSWRYSSS